MYPQIGPGVAFALTSATFLISGLAMTPEAFLSWGWRIPFVLSAVLVGVGLYVRLRIEETPVFQEAVARQELTHRRAPLGEALRHHTRQVLLAAGPLGALFGLGYIGTVYLTSYGTAVLGLPRPTMLLLGVLGGVVLAASVVVGGRSSDRFGRRRTILVGNAATIGCGLVAFPIIDTGDVVLVGVGLCLLLLVGGIALGPASAFLAELFATRYRYTAAGLSYNLAAILGGAVPPVLAAALQASYGSIAV